VSKTHKGISLAAFLSLSLWALIIIFFLIFIISKSR
jgi:hypothetical protein